MEEYIGPNSISVVMMFIIAIAAGAKGVWLFRFQAEKELVAKDALIAELRTQLEQQRLGSAARLDEERKDKLEWKELAFELSDLGKRATTVAEKSVK